MVLFKVAFGDLEEDRIYNNVKLISVVIRLYPRFPDI